MLIYEGDIIRQVPHGKLAKEITGQYLELQVLQSNAGYYLGTADKEGPVSRESGYYGSIEQAQLDLESGEFMQREEL